MNESLPLGSIDFYEDELAAYSFAYLMSQNTSYAARAKQIATYAMGQGYDGQTPYTNGMALFYDWCYGYLTAAERQTFGAAVSASGKAYLASENWTAMNNYHSKASRLAPFAYTGIALYGDGVDNAAAVSFCNMFHEHTFGAQHAIACVDEIASDGSYFEGDYNMLVLGEPFREGCWLWATATDEDAFDVSGNLQNMIDYYLYETFAKNGPGSSASMSASKQGDSKTHTVGLGVGARGHAEPREEVPGRPREVARGPDRLRGARVREPARPLEAHRVHRHRARGRRPRPRRRRRAASRTWAPCTCAPAGTSPRRARTSTPSSAASR